MGYTKLFGSIVASTIWREDDKTRILWITMLAMKNERHMVEASLPGLADMARITMEECEDSLKKLESPDKYSRNQDHQGRRVEKVQGGWLILNGEYYRRQMSEDDRREYKRKWQAEYRLRKKTKSQVRSENDGRAARFEKAVLNGDEDEADKIAAEDL